MARVTLTKKQLATQAGESLLTLLMSITHDGELSLGEIDSLRQWLSDNAEGTIIPAVAWLRELVTAVLADGHVTTEERAELLLAFERVLPLEERLVAKMKRRTAVGMAVDPDVDGAPERTSARRPRHEQPATERQIDYLRFLGAEFDESRITKVEASALIDERLSLGKPVSNRQMMVLRFWDQAAIAGEGKASISSWMDAWYAEEPRRLEAWEMWKRENGDDGRQGDPTRVPVGAGFEYLNRVPLATSPDGGNPTASTWSAIIGFAVLTGLVWLGIKLLW